LAQILWPPLIRVGRLTVAQKAPLELVGSLASQMLWSSVTFTLERAWKPRPQNLMADPILGVCVLTDTEG
jgi:hypothetical protein